MTDNLARQPEPGDQLQQLRELLDEGVLTAAEFEAKSAELRGERGNLAAVPDPPASATSQGASRVKIGLVIGGAALLVALLAGAFVLGRSGSPGEQSKPATARKQTQGASASSPKPATAQTDDAEITASPPTADQPSTETGAAAPGTEYVSAGKAGTDYGMTVKVVKFKVVSTLPLKDYADPSNDSVPPPHAKPGAQYVAVDLDLTNDGRKSIDPTYDLRQVILFDSQSRAFDLISGMPWTVGLRSEENSPTLQPGFTAPVTLYFETPKGIEIGGLGFWNSNEPGDYDGSHSNVLMLAPGMEPHPQQQGVETNS